MTATMQATRRATIVNLIAALIKATPMLTGEDVADIVKFVEEDAVCQGHESLDGPIGNVVYCNGRCVLYVGPGTALVSILISSSSDLQESSHSLVQSATESLGW